MHRRVMYGCEFCNKLYEDQDECLNHEITAHLHTTRKIYEKWEKLQKEVYFCSSAVYQTNNTETRSKYDKAVEKIIAFEEKYNLPKMKILR